MGGRRGGREGGAEGRFGSGDLGGRGGLGGGEDVHNTSNSFLLSCADALIAPRVAVWPLRRRGAHGGVGLPSPSLNRTAFSLNLFHCLTPLETLSGSRPFFTRLVAVSTSKLLFRLSGGLSFYVKVLANLNGLGLLGDWTFLPAVLRALF